MLFHKAKLYNTKGILESFLKKITHHIELIFNHKSLIFRDL